MRFFDWLRRRWRRYFSGAAGDRAGIWFEGGTGETPEAAVVVRGARFDLEGTSAEFAWLVNAFGEKDQDWSLLSHSHGEYDGRHVDTFRIQLAGGAERTIFFDCSESFGKDPPDELFVERETTPDDTIV